MNLYITLFTLSGLRPPLNWVNGAINEDRSPSTILRQFLDHLSIYSPPPPPGQVEHLTFAPGANILPVFFGRANVRGGGGTNVRGKRQIPGENVCFPGIGINGMNNWQKYIFWRTHNTQGVTSVIRDWQPTGTTMHLKQTDNIQRLINVVTD